MYSYYKYYLFLILEKTLKWHVKNVIENQGNGTHVCKIILLEWSRAEDDTPNIHYNCDQKNP